MKAIKAYYNEHDKSAAEWLRQLIKEGVITDGTVDERSIEDVVPAELAEFDRCHFFAGVGVWDYALSRAGWRDGDGQVWTGSCPCQPFSAAGKGDGFADERHLWPAWFHLIEQCRPRVIFGEQVSSKDTLPWIDLVHADLEGALYTVAAADLCSPSVGAPHIRQRLYFVGELADAKSPRRRILDTANHGAGNAQIDASANASNRPVDGSRRISGILAVTDGGNSGTERLQRSGQHGQQPQDGGIGQLADASGNNEYGRLRECGAGTEPKELQTGGFGSIGGVTLGDSADERLSDRSGETIHRGQTRGFDQRSGDAGPTNGFWRDAEWIYCRDGKWRPVGTIESGAFEMADELATDLGCVRDQSSGHYTISPLIEKGKGRVARLRGYGNAIVAEVAVKWIEAYLDK